MNKSRGYTVPFILVALLFMLWSVANNMNDTLLAAFKRIMSISDLQTSLVQFAFYGAYFCVAFPAALFIRKHNFKSGILLGLILYAVGCMLFYPAGLSLSYGFFLFAIYVMACGCSVLETTANPYVLAMGPRESATRRLNIVQALNPIGAIAGILLSRRYLGELHEADAPARSVMPPEQLQAMQQHELGAISGTYTLIGVVLIILFIIILLTRMPSLKNDDGVQPDSTLTVVKRLCRSKRYVYGVITQFFYVGVQTGVWSFTIRLTMEETGMREVDASNVFLASIIAFTLFRLLFTWLMKRFEPAKLMTGAAIAGVLFTLLVISTHGAIAIAALVSISACMSLMFPTIYGIALEDVTPSDAKIGASGLIMAILGGAIITPLQAAISDFSGSISLSFIVPLICFIVILIYSVSVNGSK